MAEDPGKQLTPDELLKSSIAHPAFTDRELPVGGESTHRGEGYAPANVQEDNRYAEAWNKQFSGQPAEEAPAAESAPEPSPQEPETTPQTPPRDGKGRFTRTYAGKYGTPEDLEKGYMEQFSETQRIIGERDALRAANLLASQQQEFHTRQERPQPQPVKLTVDEAGQAFIPPDAIPQPVTREEVDAQVNQRVTQILEPVLKGNQALNELKGQYPDYQKQEANFTKWLAVNPETSQKAVSNPESGMELAYLKYKYEMANLASQQVQQSAAQTAPVIEQARNQAARPNATRNEVTDEQSRNNKLAELYRHGQETGNYRAYEKARLHEAIPGWITNTEWGSK